MFGTLMADIASAGIDSRGQVHVKAVYDDDLGRYLASLGIDPSLDTLGKCKFCSGNVTRDNLAALFPQSGAIKLACDHAACMRGLQQLIVTGRVRL
jgi:hypothetical protein